MQPQSRVTEFHYAPAATPAYVAYLIESAVRFLELDPATSREHLLRAFALMKRGAESATSTTMPSNRGKLATWQAKRVLAYIDANLGRDLQTGELAKLARLSDSHFCRAFKVSVGMSPYEYITRRRVELARTMMKTTSAPLSQVALECGWQDQSSFCRTFRRVLGLSPNAWRRATASGPPADGGNAHALFVESCTDAADGVEVNVNAVGL